MASIVYKPARKILSIPYRVYYNLLMSVPEGYLTCKEDMEAFIAELLEVEEIRFDPHTDISFFYSHKDKIPYWREVGKTGYLFGRHIHFSREAQEENLTKENHKISTDARGAKQVKSYKEKFFDFKTAGITRKNVEFWISQPCI